MYTEEDDSNKINIFKLHDDSSEESQNKENDKTYIQKLNLDKITVRRNSRKQKTTKVETSKMLNYIGIKTKINGNQKRHSVNLLIKKEIETPLNFKNNKKLVNHVIEIFKKKEKNEEEKKMINQYILQLQPFSQVLSESGPEETQRILRHLNHSLKYKFIPENKIICKYGELIEKFYLILRGEVDVIVPNEEESILTEEEYFLYLLRLKIFNENNLINKIIAKNSSVFTIEEKNFDDWIRGAYKILVMIRGYNNLFSKKKVSKNNLNNNINIKSPSKRKSIERGSIKRSSIQRGSIQRMSIQRGSMQRGSITLIKGNKLSNINKNNENENINSSPLEKKNMIIKLQKEILCAMKILEPYNPDLMDVDLSIFIKENITTEEYIERIKPIKFEYHNNYDELKKTVKIICYFIANSLKKGNKFGDMMSDMNQNNVQTENVSTIISKENCDFGILDRVSYIKCLKEVSERQRKKKLNYLLDLNVFRGCNKNLFMNSFSNFFNKIVIQNNDILFNEGDSANNMKVYLIKKGEIELSCNKSIYEINDIFIGLNYKDLVDPEDEDEILNRETDDYIKFKKKKNFIKLQYLKGNDILGLNDAVYNDKYLYTAKCTSSIASLYEIHMNFLKLVLHSEPKVQESFQRIEMIQRNLIIKLLLKQRINKKVFFDYKSKAMSGVSFGCIKFNNIKDKNNSLKQLLEEKELKKRNLSSKRVSRHKAKIRILIDNTKKIYNENPRLFENSSKKYKKISSRNTRINSTLNQNFATYNSDLPTNYNLNQFKTISSADEELPKIKESKIFSSPNTFRSTNSKYSNSNNHTTSHFREKVSERRNKDKIKSQDLDFNNKNNKYLNKFDNLNPRKLITSAMKRKKTKEILNKLPNFYYNTLTDKKMTIFNMTNKTIFKNVLKFD